MTADQITTILTAIARVEVKLENLGSGFADDKTEAAKIHADHEARLRVLERAKWIIAGFAFAAGGAGGSALARILGG